MASFERIGEEGCRAVGAAYRTVALDHPTAVVTDETELVFAGFAVFLDPPKETAAAAISAMAQDGIAVKIITGNNERVAIHLCGQLKVEVLGVITGDELTKLSDEALLARVRG
jgi:P-type Mg2+ transporter